MIGSVYAISLTQIFQALASLFIITNIAIVKPSSSVKWQLLWIYNRMGRRLPGMEASGSFLWKLWSVKWWWDDATFHADDLMRQIVVSLVVSVCQLANAANADSSNAKATNADAADRWCWQVAGSHWEQCVGMLKWRCSQTLHRSSVTVLQCYSVTVLQCYSVTAVAAQPNCRWAMFHYVTNIVTM